MIRNCLYYDMILLARGKSKSEKYKTDFPTPPKTMESILNLIIKQFEAGNDFLWRQAIPNARDTTGGPAYTRTYLKDIKVHGGYVAMLVNRSDPTAPDFVTTNPEVGERTVHSKPDGHGGDFSAHVLVNPKNTGIENQYLTMIESMHGAGLGSSTISSFFSHMIRQCKKQYPKEFQTPHIDGCHDEQGNVVMVKINHEVKLQGHPSDSLITDLKTGTLSSVELVKPSNLNKWDSKGRALEVSRIVKMKLNHNLIGDGINLLKEIIFNARKENIPQLRVKFKKEDGEQSGALLSTADNNLTLIEEGAYVKRHRISDQNTPEITGFENINLNIIKEMTDNLR
ncbi:hypothetical protein ACSEPH_27825 [Pseudomonas aeruginosa]|uniref:hypothetical protein n=2 Tax=Pseudomonas aeruginosa TaxID=287 RepID=UPI001AE05349|nr:hypothetical protein [Pseudomonas aeruginosa]HCE9763120.1 hypothetical protein [Pseudomonas aeruginosa]HCR1213716.1 hypothetical protein [Pseudomonas aeruginosa]